MFKRRIKDLVESDINIKNFLLKIPLLIFSFFYLLFIVLRRFFYEKNIFKKIKVNCKVISIGNLTWAGTGKTELTKKLAKFLNFKDKRVGLILSDYAFDEYELLKEELKGVNIYVGKKSLLAKRHSLENDIFIIDDGFSHLKLYRDLDILIIDCVKKFGNRKVLPAGILREPIFFLKKADILVLSYAQFLDEDFLKKIKAFKKEIFFSYYRVEKFLNLSTKEILTKDCLENKKLGAFCSIGNPQGFLKLLERNLTILFNFSFIDHHKFTLKDIQFLNKMTQKFKLDFLITTKKDLVRLKGFELPFKILVALPEFEIEDEEKFFNLILSKINI